MPVFRYICNHCQHDFEVLQARFDEPVSCPKCGSDDNTKQPNLIGCIRISGPASCANRGECPSAGGHDCGCGCCHHKH